MRTRWIACLSGMLAAQACGDEVVEHVPGPVQPTPTYTEEREACADRNRLRNVYFGDLHVHTAYSFDAFAAETRTTPRQAYGFAQGEPVQLPPLDAAGEGTREARIDRPLDFAAVTDHAEYFGETEICSDPSSPAYDSGPCVRLRDSATELAVGLASPRPSRLEELCGTDGSRCTSRARTVWQRVRDTAEDVYDRSEDCSFTSFVAYEYTNARRGNSLHRNVIFRNARVPDAPITTFDEPLPPGLWERLQRECLDAEGDCDVLAIPHNSNQSSGTMFTPLGGSDDLEAQREQARTRRRFEPLVEIYQHKGASECFPGVSGVLGATDEHCGFELLSSPEAFDDCGDGTGLGGIIGTGCVSRYDYVRNVLALGLRERDRLGVNPFELGIIASTDTHSGIPGAVREEGWPGHVGDVDPDPDARLRPIEGGMSASYRDRVVTSPGGLTAVWAVENSRDAIFEALRRRETYGTSGPRMSVRFFGAWDYPEDLCDRGDFVEVGYHEGVPMGSELPPRNDAEAPTFAVLAFRDPAADATPLQRIQIIEGTVGPDGEPSFEIHEVAGDPDNGASVDPSTCERTGPGADTLCATWTDPTFDPSRDSFYYVRVLENPSCRWSAYDCATFDEADPDRPEACEDPDVALTLQERAWTSPIWYSHTR